MIVVNDATVKGGSYYPLTVRRNVLVSAGPLSFNLHIGEETSQSAGDCEGERLAMRLPR